MRIIHEVGEFVALTDHDGVERLRYDYGTAPKPFLHPIRTPGGTIVTDYEPEDHLWHRGIWFAWKFVGGVNYWEENVERFGRQVPVAPPIISAPKPNQVRIAGYLEWRDLDEDDDEITRLVECRELVVRFDPGGVLVIDWSSAQTATNDITIDRTPFTDWGGYGGLVGRFSPELSGQRFIFDDESTSERPTGEAHAWGALEGKIGEEDVTLLMIPHPGNTRFPEPFYGHAKPGSTFFGPAPLFHEPLTLKRGNTLTQRVRIVLLPRPLQSVEVAGYYEEWSQTS